GWGRRGLPEAERGRVADVDCRRGWGEGEAHGSDPGKGPPPIPPHHSCIHQRTHKRQPYTTNDLLSHPLVSPVLQPTLGGLPPLLIMVGGAEMLRDEQIFLAHKCANPAKYAPFEHSMTAEDKAALDSFGPTPVQLQVWDDL